MNQIRYVQDLMVLANVIICHADKFHENRSNSFWVLLLTNKQTDKQTKGRGGTYIPILAGLKIDWLRWSFGEQARVGQFGRKPILAVMRYWTIDQDIVNGM